MRLFFLLLPWLELFTLIQLGVETSALTALLYVLATLVLGMAIIRHQGMSLITRMQDLQAGRVLGQQLLLDGMAVGIAGLLLMVPGLISDFFAIIVLIGPLRRRLGRWLMGPQPEPYVPQRDATSESAIEGDFRRVDE
ncbi:MAG: FxsA family protein [Halioglobus sp.]